MSVHADHRDLARVKLRQARQRAVGQVDGHEKSAPEKDNKKAAPNFRWDGFFVRQPALNSGRLDFAGWQLFFDTRRLAATITQVIQFGAAHIATTLDFDSSDQRTVGLERPLDTFTAGNLAHREGAVEATIAFCNHDAFVGLHTFARTFDHVDAHDNGVTWGKDRDYFSETSNFFLLKG